MSSNNDIDMITIAGNTESGDCGYCKNSSSCKSSYGIICNNMKTETYFHLMNRGWRRCGTYFYKPTNESTCCPSYTIRTNVTNFELSKSQRKVLKQFRNFLFHGKNMSKAELLRKNKINARGDEVNKLNVTERIIKTSSANISKELSSVKKDKSHKAKTIRYNHKLEKLKTKAEKNNQSFEDVMSIYQARRSERLKKRQPKSLSQLLNYSDLREPKHFLEIRTVRCRPETKVFSDTKKAEHEVYMKYQCCIHKDSPLDVKMSQFEHFLVHGGLHPNKTGDVIDLTNSRHQELPQGQFHQQYWLDGNRLIAVGVIDIVCQALSSVYLFYDPDFSYLNLGVYSALFEINFVNQLRVVYDEPSFVFYYMGFYIHNCIKMRYKAQYHGSMLLCPVSYSWVPAEICREILNKTKFSRFSSSSEKDKLSLEDKSINQLAGIMNVMVSGKPYKLKRFLSQLSASHTNELEKFAQLVGSKVLPTMRVRLG